MPRKPRTHLAARTVRLWPACLLAGLALGAAPALSAQDQVPETHTVKKGDTLWDLAKHYLRDPFLWPEIYRLNTVVVEDPHWIYPGEVLRLAPSESITAVPKTDTPAPTAPVAAGSDTIAAPAPEDRTGIAEQLPPESEPQARPEPHGRDDTGEGLFPPARGRVRNVIAIGEERQTKALKRYEFYSSGFLTEGEHLPFGRVIGPVIPPQIQSAVGRAAPTLYTKIALEPPGGASYQVGDSLLLADASARIDPYGRVVRPTGLARVVELSQGLPIAEVVAVYGPIERGQGVLPVQTFPDAGTVKPVPVTEGVQGRVIGWAGVQELKSAGNVLFIDKGKQDGVALGDIFEVRRTPARQAEGSVTIADQMAVIQVVHVREHTATARIRNVPSPDIPAGTTARQIAKLPS